MTMANQEANFITSIFPLDDGSKITTTPPPVVTAAPTASPVTGTPTRKL